MAIIKKNELKLMKKKDLEKRLVDLKKELLKINIQIAMGTLPENPGRVGEIKRTIAKLLALTNHMEAVEKVEQYMFKMWITSRPLCL